GVLGVADRLERVARCNLWAGFSALWSCLCGSGPSGDRCGLACRKSVTPRLTNGRSGLPNQPLQQTAAPKEAVPITKRQPRRRVANRISLEGRVPFPHPVDVREVVEVPKAAERLANPIVVDGELVRVKHGRVG